MYPQPSRRTFRNLAKNALIVLISAMTIGGIVNAGSLTPGGAPGATMKTLQELWDGIMNTTDTSGVSANASGSLVERIEFIQQNLGGYTFGSGNASDVLTTAGGTFDASNLSVGNVRSGVSYGVGLTGTYTGSGGGGWDYGSDDQTQVLTTADAPGTYNANNLSAATVKNGTAFGVGLTGDYPSATNPLPGDTGATDATAGTVCNGEEAWSKAGALITGSLSPSAATIVVGNSYCGVAGTLFQNLYNGTGQSITGGAANSGGVDDYNNGASAPGNRYVGIWTACNAGNSYCGTGNSGADMKDETTGLVWSKPCDGLGCSSFSDASPDSYTWDNSGGNNNSRTANQLCSDQTGWHLPHQKEAMMAYVNGAAENLMNQTLDYYWTATTLSIDTANAWHFIYTSGWAGASGKNNTRYLRCVYPTS